MSSTDAAARRQAVPARPADEPREVRGLPADAGLAKQEPAPADVDQLLAQLQEKLASLPVIEQAKGIVMQRYQLDQGAAFQLLVRWSQGNNTKLREVCQLVVDLVTDPAPFEVLLVALQQQALEKLRSQASGRGRPAGPPA